MNMQASTAITIARAHINAWSHHDWEKTRGGRRGIWFYSFTISCKFFERNGERIAFSSSVLLKDEAMYHKYENSSRKSPKKHILAAAGKICFLSQPNVTQSITWPPKKA